RRVLPVSRRRGPSGRRRGKGDRAAGRIGSGCRGHRRRERAWRGHGVHRQAAIQTLIGTSSVTPFSPSFFMFPRPAETAGRLLSQNSPIAMATSSTTELDYRPSYLSALMVSLGALVLYLVTLAPSTAMWDTSEYIAAAYTLGLPHPPGNPLFV